VSRLLALYNIVTFPFAFAANMAADLGDALDRRARVRGVNGCECNADSRPPMQSNTGMALVHYSKPDTYSPTACGIDFGRSSGPYPWTHKSECVTCPECRRVLADDAEGSGT
jgi:hypothetical protein